MRGPKVLRPETDGERLDRFLAAALPSYSRAYLKGLIAKGCVKVEGSPKRPDYRLKAEEAVEVSFPEPGWLRIPFEDWVLHEDEALLVLDKPAGLLMHPLGESWTRAPQAALSEEEPNLAGLLQLHRPGILAARVPRCGIVHRLDRQTSGVLLVAKTRRAYESLTRAFKEREVDKVYRAIVAGVPALASLKVSAPVGRGPGRRLVKVTPLGRPAETAFRVLEAGAGAALVEARPLTGRTHQIRAHLAHLGHPVLGDPEFDKAGSEPRPPRLMLHAWRVELAHPASARRVSYRASVPRDFREFWRRLRG